MECAVCGTALPDGSRANRKYCDNCAKNGARKVRDMEKAQRRDMYIRGEFESQQPKQQTCEVCGKDFVAVNRRGYCTETCREQYRLQKLTCQHCRQPLYPLGLTGRYCSDECREKFRWGNARAKDRINACRRCGKEFIYKKYWDEYCAECAKAARTEAAAQAKDVREATPKPTTVTIKCEVCGVRFERTRHQRQYTCGAECAKKRQTIRQRENRKNKEKAAETARPATKDTFEHLCTTCKTSMADCRYFVSNHVYYPEGAKVYRRGNRLIVTECPMQK